MLFVISAMGDLLVVFIVDVFVVFVAFDDVDALIVLLMMAVVIVEMFVLMVIIEVVLCWTMAEIDASCAATDICGGSAALVESADHWTDLKEVELAAWSSDDVVECPPTV